MGVPVRIVQDDTEDLLGSTRATCWECGFQVDAYGVSAASVERCLDLLREECPTGSEYFYEVED